MADHAADRTGRAKGVSSVSNEDITEVGNDWQIMLSHTLYKDQGFGAGQIWHDSGPLYNYKKAPAPTFRNFWLRLTLRQRKARAS